MAGSMASIVSTSEAFNHRDSGQRCYDKLPGYSSSHEMPDDAMFVGITCMTRHKERTLFTVFINGVLRSAESDW